MKKHLILILLIVGLYPAANAQDDSPGKNEQMESMKIAFITRSLNLTPKEAAAFWPVYNEFSNQIKNIRKKEKDRTDAFKSKANPDDQESDKYIADHFNGKQQEIDITRKYISEFRKVLPAFKVAQLITLDQEFKKQLLMKMKRQ